MFDFVSFQSTHLRQDPASEDGLFLTYTPQARPDSDLSGHDPVHDAVSVDRLSPTFPLISSNQACRSDSFTEIEVTILYSPLCHLKSLWTII